MTTISFPVVEQDITHAQWRSLFNTDDGIFNCDGTASTNVGLTLSAVDDTATVGLGEVRLQGFILQVTAAHALTLAAVTGTAKTYSVGVMYDPANEAAAAGPLALYSALKTAITVPTGGTYLPLYEVTRAPSQVLSQATRVDLRRYIGPNILLTAGAALPTDAPLGTRLWDGADEYVRVRNTSGTGATWSNITSPTWSSITPVPSGTGATQTSASLSGTQTPRSRLREGEVVLTGTFSKVNGDGFGNGTNTLGTLATAHRPDRTVALAAACEQRNTYNTVRVQVDAAGIVTAVTPSTVSDFPHWICLDGLRFSLKGTDS